MSNNVRRVVAAAIGAVTVGGSLVVSASPASAQVRFSAVTQYPAPELSAVVLGDLNGDGDLDQVTSGQPAQVTVRLGAGDGSFGASSSYPTTAIRALRLRSACGESSATSTWPTSTATGRWTWCSPRGVPADLPH